METICLNQNLQFLYIKQCISCSTRLGVGTGTFYFVHQLHVIINYRSSYQKHFIHFVDDSTVFASDSDMNNVHATLNRELIGVDNWLKANRLSTNVRKTSYYMIISIQKKHIWYYNSRFDPYEHFNQGVKNIGRWTQQEVCGKSWRNPVSAGNSLTS